MLALAIVALVAYGTITVLLLRNASTEPSGGTETATVFAVGDLAGEGDGAQRVSDMLGVHNFDALLTLGDHAYEGGTQAEFERQYQPTYGRFDDRVRPAPGNHDYEVPAAADYFAYFEDRAQQFPGRPYYAFSLAGWRIYSLNSEIGEGDPGSGMYEWLRTDLNAQTGPCILAYWHRPVFTVGRKEPDEGHMARIWAMLAARGADIVLAGHDHNYQRWESIDGITSFVVGTGGRSRYDIDGEDARAVVTDDDHYGALQLDLGSGGAHFVFRDDADEVLDSGDVACGAPVTPPTAPAPPTSVQALPTADGTQEELSWTPPELADGVMGYVVRRGNDTLGFTTGTTFSDTTLAPGSSVLYTVQSVNQAGVRSERSSPAHSGGQVIGYSSDPWAPAGENPSAPTHDKPQSKLWSIEGAWWGLMWRDDAEAGGGYYLHRFDPAAQAWTPTDVRVDERDRSHADVLWDAADQRLFVLSTIDSGATKLYRFSYADGAFTADDGFPVRISERGSESATIARDSLDRLWVALTLDPGTLGPCSEGSPCGVFVMHSTSADYRWTNPIAMPAEGAVVAADDIAAVVAYGDGQIGVAWSNQADGSFRFASHAPADGDDTWSSEVLVVAPRGSDDHLNMKADDQGRVFLVVKTSLNDVGATGPAEPLVTVWVREASGLWRSGTAWQVADDVTRPQIMVDAAAGLVAVVAAAPGTGGAIYAKTADIATLKFEGGLGELLMLGVRINNPTTTKQQVDLGAGALVLAGDTETHVYWHNMVTRP